MTVTSIEPVTKTKYRVFADGQFAFVLYKGELSRYGLVQGEDVDRDVLEKIRTEVVLKRAKLRAMHLLNDMDRTEGQLRTKLRQGEYPEDIIEQAVQYVKSFGYINDAGYAGRFIQSKKQSKSRKEIYALLLGKGLGKEIVERAMEEAYADGDSACAIETLLRKKRYDPASATEEETRKIYGFLARKGFAYDDIRQVIQVSRWNA